MTAPSYYAAQFGTRKTQNRRQTTALCDRELSRMCVAFSGDSRPLDVH